MSKQVVGQVAIQQAMIKELGLTYRKAAQILKVNHRTIWQHVAAKSGSKVRAWEKRTTEQRENAVGVARGLVQMHAIEQQLHEAFGDYNELAVRINGNLVKALDSDDGEPYKLNSYNGYGLFHTSKHETIDSLVTAMYQVASEGWQLLYDENGETTL